MLANAIERDRGMTGRACTKAGASLNAMRMAMTMLPVVLASCTLMSGIGDIRVGDEGELTPEQEAGPSPNGDSGATADGSGAEDPESGLFDTGVPETGKPDTGTPDSGSGVPDAGKPDTGTGIVDAGQETGVIDPGPPVLVQSKSTSGSGSTLTLSLNAATKLGSLIVLGIGRERTVSSISDNAAGGPNAYVRAGNPGTHPNCVGNEIGAEIWYARNVKAGVTSVTVTFSGSGPAQIWGIEVANMNPTTPLEATASTSNAGLSTSLTAPKVVTSVAETVVMSTGVCCSTITGLKSGTGFTAFPVLNGNSSAYMIAQATGNYGASWNTDNCVSGSTTAAFK